MIIPTAFERFSLIYIYSPEQVDGSVAMAVFGTLQAVGHRFKPVAPLKAFRYSQPSDRRTHTAVFGTPFIMGILHTDGHS